MLNEITSAACGHSVTIAQAKDQLEMICRTYLETDDSGKSVIPVNRQRPIMLMGPAGIGKTDIPKQAAEELGLGYVSYSITHHTRQSALGLPKIVSRSYNGENISTTEYTASEIVTSVRDEIERTGNPNGILFIDEVNCASETLAAPMLQLFQNKTLGQSKIPDGWILVMAGNPPEYNKSVKEFDAVTRDRLRVINIVPDSGAWLGYAAEKKLHPIITSYITSDNSKLYCFDENDNSIVTPRGWEELSITLNSYEKHGFPVTIDVVEQFIAVPTVAGEFFDYYRLVKETITEEEIDLIVNGKATSDMVSRLKKCSVNIRFMLIECMRRKLHLAAASGDMKNASAMMDNISDFVEKLYGKNGEIEIFMSGILVDGDIVKAALVTQNQRFGRYLDNVTSAESNIKKKMKNSSKK
ncbi:MAG: AAA family ATPase [Oscillospiraceae bacterium]